MKQLRYWSFLPVFCFWALPLLGQNSIEIGGSLAKAGDIASIPITLNNNDPVQGVVVVVEWDGAIAVGDSLVEGAALADADVVVQRVESNYAVLGVVVDNDGSAPDALPPGSHLLATLNLAVDAGATGSTLDVSFVDDTHARVDGGPNLDNIIVIAGLSSGIGDGLDVTPASLGIVDCIPRFFIGQPGGENPGDANTDGDVRVMMENCEAVEGYVVALCHDSNALTLNSISVGDAANAVGAEFSASEILTDGGWLAVILDNENPFEGQVIAPGVNNVAIFNYTGDFASVGAVQTALTFCDGVLGTPVKDNVYVSGGLSLGEGEGVAQQDGVYEVEDGDPPPPFETNCADEVDNDLNGLVDQDDPGLSAIVRLRRPRVGRKRPAGRCPHRSGLVQRGLLLCAEPRG